MYVLFILIVNMIADKGNCIKDAQTTKTIPGGWTRDPDSSIL